MAKRVLSVGNCSFDHGRVEGLIVANFDAQVVAAGLQEEAIAMLDGDAFDLVLVNRKLAADSSDGMKLIEQIRADSRLAATPVMLLSNYAEAQEAAIAAGAIPGFGKAALDHPETLAKLAEVLADA